MKNSFVYLAYCIVSNCIVVLPCSPPNKTPKNTTQFVKTPPFFVYVIISVYASRKYNNLEMQQNQTQNLNNTFIQ